jgi:hypothetical protein
MVVVPAQLRFASGAVLGGDNHRKVQRASPTVECCLWWVLDLRIVCFAVLSVSVEVRYSKSLRKLISRMRVVCAYTDLIF